MRRAIESAARLPGCDTPFHIAPNAGKSIGGGAPLRSPLARNPLSVEYATPQLEARRVARCRAPVEEQDPYGENGERMPYYPARPAIEVTRCQAPAEEQDRYGENGERMPYYPARPRGQGSYELVRDQYAWRSSAAGAGAEDVPTETRETSDKPASLEW
jgi:hypothetical protein